MIEGKKRRKIINSEIKNVKQNFEAGKFSNN
jgi:hypothetical protein